MKVSLISVKSEPNLFGFQVPPMACIYLGTILKQAGHEVRVYDENVCDVYDRKTGKISSEVLNSEVVGVSLITPPVPRGEAFLKEIKRQNPEARTLAGGFHFLDYEEAERFAEFTDLVVRGEGENIIVDAVENGLEGVVNGVKDGKHELEFEPVMDLDELPFPDFSIVKNLNKRNWVERAFGKLMPVETSRGCPHKCNFCSEWKYHGRKTRYKSAERELEEVRRILKMGHNRILFIDDNYSAIPNRRGRLESMVKVKERNPRLTTITIDGVPIIRRGEEYIKLMKRAGIDLVMLGVESLNPKTLEWLGKPHTVEEAERCVKAMARNGIRVHCFGIMHSVYDDEETVIDFSDKVRKWGAHSIQIVQPIPIPGTNLYEEVENNLLTRDFSSYTGLCYTFDLANEGREKALERAGKVERIAKRAWLRFYGRKALSHVWRAVDARSYREMVDQLKEVIPQIFGYYIGTKIKPARI